MLGNKFSKFLFYKLKHFLCAMFSDKLDSEISVG